MSLTYSEIKTSVDAGNTASEIAEALNAITQHKRDCWATKQDADAFSPDLLFMLSARYDVLALTTSATWEGDLVDAINASGNSGLIQGFKKLLTQLQITGRKVLANSDATGLTGYLVTAIAGIVGQIVEARGQGTTQAEVVTDVYTLTGGPLYAGVTAEQVQALIDKQAKLDLIETAKAAELVLLQKHGTARNRLENVEAVVDDLTSQQVTDEIAEIRTYPETYTVPGGE